MDDYRQRVFGARGGTVPDFRDILTESNVNELGTAQFLNGWVVIVLYQTHGAFSSSGWTHNSTIRVRKGGLSEYVDTYGMMMSFGPSSLPWLLMSTCDTVAKQSASKF